MSRQPQARDILIIGDSDLRRNLLGAKLGEGLSAKLWEPMGAKLGGMGDKFELMGAKLGKGIGAKLSDGMGAKLDEGLGGYSM